MQRKFKSAKVAITLDEELKEKITLSIGSIDLIYQDRIEFFEIFAIDTNSKQILGGKSSYGIEYYKEKFRDQFASGDLAACMEALNKFESAESEMMAAINAALKTMFVVSVSDEPIALPDSSLAEVLFRIPLTNEKIEKPNEPFGIVASNIAEVKNMPWQYKKTKGNPRAKKTENIYSLATIQKIYDQCTVNTIPSVLVFANGNCPGGVREGNSQEESIIRDSNLAFGMPSAYSKNDIYDHYNGIYAVLCHTNEGQLPFWAIVMAAPNLSSSAMKYKNENDIVKTPSDAELFGIEKFRPDLCKFPRSYMRHVLGQVLMQFYMAKLLGSEHFITGQFGAGVFNANPEYYAAAVKYVSQLTSFAKIQVVNALGPNKETISGRKVVDVFDTPKDNLILLADELYKHHFAPYQTHFQDEAVILAKISNRVTQFYKETLPAEMQSIKKSHHQKVEIARRENALIGVLKEIFVPEPLMTKSPKP